MSKSTPVLSTLADLQPGDAFRVLMNGGPQAEVIFWGRAGDDLVVTWALRDLDDLGPDEGPKDCSEPWLLTPGDRTGTNRGMAINFTSAAGRGLIGAASGRYQARDERSNSVAIMAAKHEARLEYLARGGR